MSYDQKDPIKEAFQRAKQDILDLKNQLNSLSVEISSLRSQISSLQTDKPTDRQTNNSQNPSFQHINSTDKLTELHKQALYGLKTPNTEVSIGNRGVPTDRQTNQQTDQHPFVSSGIPSQTDRISHAINTINEEKSNLRRQFKSLTKQEMLVYLTIYQLEEEGISVDYSHIASKLHLSESSIRDYVLRILKKSAPLIKTKENNKRIILRIPSEFKQIASIQALLSLKEV